MRSLGWLILLAVVGGLVWAVGWGPLKDISLTQILEPKGSQPAPSAEPQPDEKAAASKAPARSPRASNAAAAPPNAEVPPPAEAPVPAAAPPPPRKFPTAAELPPGMRGSRIEATYGPPVARTISVDQNGQIEVFIYRRSEPAAVTFVHLRNGQVMSASTTNY